MYPRNFGFSVATHVSLLGTTRTRGAPRILEFGAYRMVLGFPFFVGQVVEGNIILGDSIVDRILVTGF